LSIERAHRLARERSKKQRRIISSDESNEEGPSTSRLTRPVFFAETPAAEDETEDEPDIDSDAESTDLDEFLQEMIDDTIIEDDKVSMAVPRLFQKAEELSWHFRVAMQGILYQIVFPNINWLKGV
jgi:hypothetical protein